MEEFTYFADWKGQHMLMLRTVTSKFMQLNVFLHNGRIRSHVNCLELLILLIELIIKLNSQGMKLRCSDKTDLNTVGITWKRNVKPNFVFFGFQYLGCIEVLRSMRSLDFTTRSQITRYVKVLAGI